MCAVQVAGFYVRLLTRLYTILLMFTSFSPKLFLQVRAMKTYYRVCTAILVLNNTGIASIRYLDNSLKDKYNGKTEIEYHPFYFEGPTIEA